MTSLADLTAIEARRLIGTRALSPVELVESCIARIERVDHAVNAIPTRDFERALDTAREAERAVMTGDALGALHGLPIGVKDLEDTEGLRTTYGSPLFSDHVPAHDIRMVAKLRAAGAIVLGKTNTPEFGAGANTRNAVFGATGNPFNPAMSAAGSSGGSAVALACGMVPLATGSDMGGSLRNPAGFCGIVGFRPSPGLVPSEGRAHLYSPLSVLGPMARDVPDLRLMLHAMAGWDTCDPYATQTPLPQPATIDTARLRVAISADLGFAPTERAIAAVFEERMRGLASQFTVMEQAHPDCDGADEAFATLRSLAFLGAHLSRVRNHRDQVGPNIVANVEEGLRYSAEDVARAFSLQTALYTRWQAFFSRYDLLITPTLTISPRPWTELFPTMIDGKPTKTYFHWLALAYAVTLVGHPAISVPLGLDHAGMPFGVQIVGPRGGDAFLLDVAAAIEINRPVPSLEALAAAAAIAGMDGFMGFGKS